MVGLEAPRGQESYASPSTSAPFDAPHLEVSVHIVGLITGILLYIVGSILERHERAQYDRESRERWKGYGVDKQGNHHPLDGRWK
jgi:hypothetical protein